MCRSDNGAPAPTRGNLVGHTVTRAPQIGWEARKNGDLVRQAEEAGYDLLLSTDKEIKYQQNLKGRKIAIVITLDLFLESFRHNAQANTNLFCLITPADFQIHVKSRWDLGQIPAHIFYACLRSALSRLTKTRGVARNGNRASVN